MKIKVTKKQFDFCKADATEVLFGGAAGGGKSYAQVIDALVFALKYKGSKQLIVRRSYPELEKSLIRTAQNIYPSKIYNYNSSKHSGKFINGSIIDFASCDSDRELYKFQSAEYDVIRFDELTHFTEDVYLYLISRLRGANSYPKQIKSCTNPGGVGHNWVRERFINSNCKDISREFSSGSRVFIESRVFDNKFLIESDPEYVKRLHNLREKDKKALLYGNWDVFEGQYFTEWDRVIHTIKPFSIPSHYKHYFTMDYGFDMAAFYWISVDSKGCAYVVREFCQGKDNGKSPLIISEAARVIKELTKEKIFLYLAPPDIWNSRQESGRSIADIFLEEGIPLTKSGGGRVEGWMSVKEYLKPFIDIDGQKRAKLTIFDSCTELISSLPALLHDNANPSDVSSHPHKLTHSADAIRGFCNYFITPSKKPKEKKNLLFAKKQEINSSYKEEGKINVI